RSRRRHGRTARAVGGELGVHVAPAGLGNRHARRPLHGAPARRDARLRDAVNVALVVNPFATRVSEERLAEVRAELERVADLDVLFTEHPGHATDLVTGACRGGVEAVVVFSGDGGFNEALNGLESDLPIGFLPGGGASVLSRALGLSRDPAESARQVAAALSSGRARRISLGRGKVPRLAV